MNEFFTLWLFSLTFCLFTPLAVLVFGILTSYAKLDKMVKQHEHKIGLLMKRTKTVVDSDPVQPDGGDVVMVRGSINPITGTVMEHQIPPERMEEAEKIMKAYHEAKNNPDMDEAEQIRHVLGSVDSDPLSGLEFDDFLNIHSDDEPQSY